TAFGLTIRTTLRLEEPSMTHEPFVFTANPENICAARSMPAPHAALDGLAALVTWVASNPALWRPWVRHDPVTRWYVRLWRTPTHEVWLLCWTAGQGVALHDHGGSAGAFCVAEGMLVEEQSIVGGPAAFVRCEPGRSRTFPVGRLHGVSNPGPAPASSLHVYSPPLSSMTFYERDRSGMAMPG